MPQKCERCGSCCLQISGISDISEEDIRRWVNTSRRDILQYCDGWRNDYYKTLDKEQFVNYLCASLNMEMWFDPESKDELDLCPFLIKKRGVDQFECVIHDSKPKICRDYNCDPENMIGIIKKPFTVNLAEYKKQIRRRSARRSA